MTVDVTQLLGDTILLGSYLLIIISIHRNKSCKGWSGRMQILIVLTFLSRYCVTEDNNRDFYNILVKLICIGLSVYILYLIYMKYNATYEKRCDTFWIESVILACLACAFIFCSDVYEPEEIAFLFSYFNESLSILPQCYFVLIKRQKEKIVTYYVIGLSLYKLLYIGHWLIIYSNKNYLNSHVFYPALIQTFLYGVYLLLPRGKPKDEESAAEPTVRRNLPTYLTQASLLESPLLKRSTSSIFIIGDNSSDTSSINRSISDSSSVERERY